MKIRAGDSEVIAFRMSLNPYMVTLWTLEHLSSNDVLCKQIQVVSSLHSKMV